MSSDYPAAPVGLNALLRLEDLPLLRRGTALVGEDSHDVSGANNDGFNANFSYLYKEGEEFVLFDEEGPGCIYVLRTIGHKGRLRVYLDGAKEPQLDLPFKEFYSGGLSAFPLPFVAREEEAHGSSWCYVPITYAKSCKITTDEMEPPHFYNIFAHKYAPGTQVATFNGVHDLTELAERWRRPEQLPAAPKLTKLAGTLRVGPRQWMPVLDKAASGAIRSLRLRVAGGNARLAALLLRGYWDGHALPDIDSPVSSFFGVGCPPALAALERPDPEKVDCEKYVCGRTPPRSLFVGEDDNGWLYCNFPMPYWSEARLELFNNLLSEEIEVEYEIGLSEEPYPDSACWFRALWRSEGPLRPGEDYCVLDVRGEGHYVGCVLTLSSYYQSPRGIPEIDRGFLEGDARFYVDGNRTPFIASTGTEEYFNWGWYDVLPHDKPFVYPTHGYPLHMVERDDTSVMYRFHWGDVAPFSRSFRFDLEHGPEGTTLASYSGTAFFYQKSFEPRLVLTDELDVGDDESEQHHAYTWKGEGMVDRRTLPYEGSYQLPKLSDCPIDRAGAVKDSGRVWNGSSTFTLHLEPNNDGARLRRRSYFGFGATGEMGTIRETPNLTHAQRVKVSVDGEDVGEWYVPAGHGRQAWRDTEFELPASVTAGKKTVSITLQSLNQTLWDEYMYWIYSYVRAETKAPPVD
jgi:hypothetical protein